MFTGFLSYAGVEIVNEARLAAYVTSLNIPGKKFCAECVTLRTAFGHDPYTNPTTDNAPWYDPAIPESGQVAGFQIQSIDGLGDTATRPVNELSRDGAVVGTRRRQSRELVITLLAVASNECALSYAAGWLSRVLRGQDCTPGGFFTPGCANSTLCMLTCCPTSPADLAKYQVSLFNVGVTQGPTILRHQKSADEGCVLALCEIEVVFTAGDPGWYSPAVEIFDGPIEPFFIEESFYNIKSSYFGFGCGPAPGGGTTECTTDLPDGCVPTSDLLQAPLPDPCIGTLDLNPRFNYYSIPLDLTTISTWMDLVPTLYYTGSPGSPVDPPLDGPVAFQLRRPNPEEPCGTRANPCNVCLELFAPGMLRGVEGVFDWISRKAFRINSTTDQCPFPVFTRNLAPFNWPTITCGAQMCLDIYINAENDGRASLARFELMRRQDAIC